MYNSSKAGRKLIEPRGDFVLDLIDSFQASQVCLEVAMILWGKTFGLMDQLFDVRSKLFSFSKSGKDSLMLDDLRAHRLDQRLSVFRASVQLSELEPMSHLYKQAMDVIKIITFL